MQQGAAGCSRVQKVAHKDWERDGVRDWAKAGGLGAAAMPSAVGAECQAVDRRRAEFRGS